MANYYFNPGDYATGTDLTTVGWTKRFVAVANGDAWAIAEPSAGLKTLQFTQGSNSTTESGISLDAIDEDIGRANAEMLAVFRTAAGSADPDCLLFARGSGEATNETFVFSGIQTDDDVERRVGQCVSGALNVISTSALTSSPDYRGTGTWLALRARINLNSAYIKFWVPADADDPVADEPVDWWYSSSAITVADAGWVGIGRLAFAPHEYKRLAIATGGDTATFSAPPSVPVAFSGPIDNQAGTEGVAFSLDTSTYFSGSETPFSYSVQAGTLPAGLSLNGSTGVLSGTPTTAGVSSGIVVRATDAMLNTADSNTFSITIDAVVVVTPPSFIGPNVDSITTPAGTPETLDISSRWSGDLPQTFTAIGTWPSGASVSSDGILQITDLVSVGDYSGLVVRATNTAGFADSNAFTLTVEAITYAASFETDVMYSLSGIVQANKAVSWTWVPGGRVGDLAGRDVFDGVGTTTAEGRYLVDEVPEGDGLALVTILGETRQDDQVYLEYGTATEEGG